MTMLGVLAVSLTVLLLLAVPVAFALVLSATIAVLSVGDIDLMIVPQQVYQGLDSFLLLAIPLFLLAGELMSLGGMTDRLLGFSNALFGRFRGGLAMSNVASATLMAGISGSAVADTSALGKVLIPSMIKAGYDRGFAAALTAAANVVGPIIPPSITFLVISVLTNLSPLKLFMSAVIPGLMYATAMMLVALIVSRRRNYPTAERVGAAGMWHAFVRAIWALAMPVLLIVGIRTGVFNVTESSAVAVAYALFVGLFVHRELDLRKLWQALVASARGTAVIMIILGGAQIVSWFLAYEQAPQRISEWMLGSIGSPVMFLLVVNVLLLLVGTFMENGPALVLLCPVLYPVAAKFGIDPYHFSMIVGINLLIGLITPPVAICLSIGALIAKAPSDEVNREAIPFLGAAIGVVLLVTYVPALSTWLPAVVGGR
ncbi:MAG: TRAP transporter large permease [Burkholderiaceae bacterium]|jgi:tripartite ATP-independent transporter DctM subunit|nr:TRAP transporter large permease [Burkholderiales bacterium]MCZ8340127.1 TRAP transporter large permease [Burkholderiaceae bacterium]